MHFYARRKKRGFGKRRGCESPFNLEYVVILSLNETIWLRSIACLFYLGFDAARLSGDAIFSLILSTLLLVISVASCQQGFRYEVSCFADNNCGSLFNPTLILLCLWKASICYSALVN